MPSLGYFKPLDSMKNDPCEFCGKPGTEILIQDMVPGGGYLLTHGACFDKFMEEFDEEDQNDSEE